MPISPSVSAGGEVGMRVLAGKLFVAALLGGAVSASLALPRIFDSAQRPLAARLPGPRAAEAQNVRLPFFLFQTVAKPQALRLGPALPAPLPLALPRFAAAPVSAASVPQTP